MLKGGNGKEEIVNWVEPIYQSALVELEAGCKSDSTLRKHRPVLRTQRSHEL
jgi:hypothetical protein